VNDRVQFLGFVPDKEMASFFQSVDVVVFPYSQCTTSGALSLALAHGCVALTSNLPFLELKDRYDCVEIFDLDNRQSLIDQLKKVLLNERRRSAVAQGA
jgi:glycosyltransferase involved in cell wall biosynthesis